MENFNTSNEKTKLILKKVSPDQKKLLLTGVLGLSAFATGFGLSSMGSADDNTLTSEQPEVCEDICVESSVPVSTSENNHLSFEEAFESARDEVGKGGFFTWNGQTYNTFYKEEWDAMSTDEKEEYFAAVDAQTDFNSMTPITEEQNEITSIADAEDLEEAEIQNAGPDIKYADSDHDGYIDSIFYDNNEDQLAESIYHLNTEAEVIYIDTDMDNVYDQVIISKFDEEFDRVYNNLEDENFTVIEMEGLMSPEEASQYSENNHNDVATPEGEDIDPMNSHDYHQI